MPPATAKYASPEPPSQPGPSGAGTSRQRTRRLRWRCGDRPARRLLRPPRRPHPDRVPAPLLRLSFALPDIGAQLADHDHRIALVNAFRRMLSKAAPTRHSLARHGANSAKCLTAAGLI